MPGRGEIVMTIAEKLRKEGMEKGKLEGVKEGERKGKLEERKRFIEFIIKNLSKRFGTQLTEEIKDKIR